MANRYLCVFLVGLVWVVLDQITKAMIAANIALGHGVTVIPGMFDLVHVLNRGAAFGFLNDGDTEWQFWLFVGAAALVTGIILNMVRTIAYSRALCVGLGSILGGAMGNLIDRVRSRAVTDFFDVYLGQWHWPAFNVADVAICLGVAAVAVILLREPAK